VRRGPFIALSLLLDAIFINVGIILAFLIRFGGDLPAFNFDAYVATAPLITAVYLVSGYIYGLYQPERTETPWAIARATIAAVTLGAAITAAVLFLGGLRFASFSRFAIFISWFLHVGLLVAWRLLFLRVSAITWPEQCVLIVGTGALARELARELSRRSRWGFQVRGLVSTPCDEEDAECPEGGELSATDPPRAAGVSAALPEAPVLGDVAVLPRLVAEHGIDRVIVVSPVALRELIEELVLADEANVRIDVVPELYEVFIGRVDAIVSDIPLMEITRPTSASWSAAAKRALDILFSALLLVILSPVLLIAAIAVLASMGRPVFFSQERVGKDMKPFNVHKFRTMVKDAEKDTGPVLAADDDARITGLGGFLRTYRVDELPQLWNILVGEMSFVGPRPEREFFTEEYVAEIPGYRERFHVKPGVTGLAQVSGGYATTPERKLKYDLIYMYHQNLAMDLQIIIETLRVILTGRGAR
jgi:exopolysaccharide biosynthesis polyprenyl glycosylphosphotransferase